MDLGFSEEQDLLRATVREISERYSSPATVRELEDDPVGYRPDLWAELAATGILGLTVDEEHGGAGLGPVEQAVVCEELGRALVPSPHLTTAVIGVSLLQQAGTPAQRGEWLPRIVAGEAVWSTAWLEPRGGCGARGISARGQGAGDGAVRVHGTKILVPFANSADRLVAPVRTGDGAEDIDLLLLDPHAAGVELTPVAAMAHDPEFLVALDGVEVAGSERIGGRGEGWAAWQRASIDALVALAAVAVGGAARAHEMAVEYAKERVQFDRPIGSFQAMAHPLAELHTEIQGARGLAYEAAWARGAGRDAGTLAAMAKYYAADVYRRATKLGHQVFGGIGFTTAIDMQLYFRRAKQLELTWWDPRELEERIAAAELDAETPFVAIDAGS